MRTNHTHQPLSYEVRLPHEAQNDVLRLLDASRAVVNTALALLWPAPDNFGSERTGLTWKQVNTTLPRIRLEEIKKPSCKMCKVQISLVRKTPLG